MLALFKQQKEDLKTSKRLIFEKISKYYPFDQPYYLAPHQAVLTKSLRFDDLLTKADDLDEVGTPSKMPITFDTSCMDETDARQHEEVGGITSSSQNEKVPSTPEVKIRINKSNIKCSEIDQTTDG